MNRSFDKSSCRAASELAAAAPLAPVYSPFRPLRCRGKTLPELEEAIDGEVDRLKTAPIADWEIEKARIGARRSLVAGLGSSLNRAVQLSEDALFYNDPDRINTRADRIAKVSAADVQRVATQYLIKTNRSVVLTMPKAPAAGRGGQ
jgi:zinc protease